MTKKDYIKIATVLKSYGNANTKINKLVAKLVDEMATTLKQDNPRFNRDKFYKACGIAL